MLPCPVAFLRQGDEEYFQVFDFIHSAEIVRATRDGRMLDAEIPLSDWVSTRSSTTTSSR